MTIDPTPPTCTVVVCAYTEKRWDDLVAAVLGAVAQGPTEVLLTIDHNDLLLARARHRFAAVASVRVLANRHRRGLSGARNTAIAEAMSDIVVFLDDDATPEPGWLVSLMAPYADATVVAVGGAAIPVWPTSRPATLPAGRGSERGELDWVVGCTYTGQPTAPADVRNLMGCNMSFRADVLAQVGDFSEDLGRIGRTPLGCEETEYCIRVTLANPGVHIVFNPSARVRHRVSADRVTWKYLLDRSWAEGVSKAAVSGMVGQDAALSTERGYVVRTLPAAMLRELARLRFASAGAIVAGLGATCAGYLRGRWSGRRRRVGHGVSAPTDPRVSAAA